LDVITNAKGGAVFETARPIERSQEWPEDTRETTRRNECNEEAQEQSNDHVEYEAKQIPDLGRRLINMRKQTGHDIRKTERNADQQDQEKDLKQPGSCEEVLSSGWLHLSVERPA
jgi:hypothetical protein